MKTIGLVTALGIALVVLAGCNSGPRRPPTYPVTGTVTQKGKPLAGATIVFVPTDKTVEPAAGVSDATGKFELTTFSAGDGAQAGEYRVKVSQYNLQKATTEEKKQYLTIEEEQKMAFAKDELPTPPAKNMLAKKYESEVTSGIVHTVPTSASSLDIKLD